MATDTSNSWRKLTLYSLFVRNFSQEGSFRAVIPQLDKIKALGTDVIWFLPFYPVGEDQRKGQAGSPYAIMDYKAVAEDHGSLEDFKALVAEIHQRDMMVMIDIVFNHTSPDSVWARTHPEWFYRDDQSLPSNRIADWWDVVDLDYRQEALWDQQIAVLKFWAELVDGFRCDVASLVPLEFWLQARREVAKVKEGVIWLAESVEPSFIRHLRAQGYPVLSDGELYQAFDMTYDYDVAYAFEGYLRGEVSLTDYVQALNRQEVTYPANYIKLRHLENHDRPRIRSWVQDLDSLKQWQAFYSFQKGASLIYNGQEVAASHTPSLFDKDPIQWETGDDLREILAHLNQLKKSYVPVDNRHYWLEAHEAAQSVSIHYLSDDAGQENVLGVFNLKAGQGRIPVPLADGSYSNLVTGIDLVVQEGQIAIDSTPALVVYS